MMIKVAMGTAFALVTMLASPAFAGARQGNSWEAYHSYAQYDGPQRVVRDNRRHSPRRSWDIYSTQGRYVGSDPDPNVRDMIARDPEVEGQGW